jgi:hypothetical protein
MLKTKAKYDGKPLDWKAADCARMARSHLVAMGHRKLPKIPRYSSAAGAKRALKSLGFDSLEALFDSLLPRIAPAEMRQGDIAIMRGDKHFDAVTICLGLSFYGWHGASERDEPVSITSRETSILADVKAAYRA